MESAQFLANIAARLGRPRLRSAPPLERHGAVPQLTELPRAELAQRFASELTAVSGEVVQARSAAEAVAALVAELERARGVVSWSKQELTKSCGLDLSAVWDRFRARWREPGSPDFRGAALASDVGVSGADAAIADTGTLLLASGVGRPRSASLLPSLHVALVSERRLVSRLGQALSLWGERPPSALQHITGPSRTSDIENDLSIGVHGPARVLVILVPEDGR